MTTPSLEQVDGADTTGQSASNHFHTHLVGRRLLMARLAWVSGVLITLVLCVGGLPVTFATLLRPCPDAGCASTTGQLTAGDIQALRRLGFPLDVYAYYWLTITILLALVFFTVGALLAWRKSDDWMALLVSLLLFTTGAAVIVNELLYNASFWSLPTALWYPISSFIILLTFALFPNGRFVPHWTLLIVLIYPTQLMFFLLFLRPVHFPGWTIYHNPLNAICWFGCQAVLALAQMYRYLRVSNQLERQQVKWIALAFIVIFLAGFGETATEHLLSIQSNGFSYITLMTLLAVMFLITPVAFGMAVLRYRLWEIDVILSRTLVYGALTACVVGLYILVVFSLGVALQTSGNLLISLAATGLVAVLFQPLRDRVQRGVNRLLYGQRDEPYTIISGLSQRLGAVMVPDAALPTIVETVAQALKLPYAAVAMRNESGHMTTAAAYGAPRGAPLTLPLVYQHEALGELLLCPRQPGDEWTPGDRLLLEELARQVGVAIHAVQLTADLRRSRERLVTAREEERRRLRRDLHDGLGPALAALSLKAEAARSVLFADPAESGTLLADVTAQAQAAIADVRRLVYDLRPPALDDLGLIGAIRAQAAQYAAHDLSIFIEAPETLPQLPAALEVAAYRIAQEALTNVVRHAQAHQCHLCLRLSYSALEVEITDDGVGMSQDRSTGVGLISMRERTEEVGGSCIIAPAPAGGVRVWASFPRT